MDFGSVLYAAQKNERSANKDGKCYKTAFAPPKKEVKEHKVLSVNVKRFLEKREKEEKQKVMEAKRKREGLVALRSQDKKATKRVQVMLKRTKSANKSVIADAVDNVNTAVTMAGPVQPDEDDYGYVSQEASAFYNKLMDKYSHMPPEEPKFPQAKKATVKDLNAAKDRVRAALQREEEEEMMPHKRKRKKKSDENEKDTEEREEYEEATEEVEEVEEPKPKKIKCVAPPLPSFDQILQIASKKQFEPIKIEKKVKDDEPERPMTKKQKLEYEREKQWKMNRSEREAMRERKEESLKEKKTLHSESSALNRIPKVSDSQDIRINRIPKLSDSNRIQKVSDSQNNRISKSSDVDNRISKLSDSRKHDTHDKRPELQNNRISKLSESQNNKLPKLSDKNNSKISDNYNNRIPKVSENARQSDSIGKHEKRDDTDRYKSLFDSRGKSSKTNNDTNDRKSSSSNERYISKMSNEKTSKPEYRPSKISSADDRRLSSSSTVYNNDKYSSGDSKSSKTTLSAKDRKALFKSPSPPPSSSSSSSSPSTSVEERLKKSADVWSKPCNLTPPRPSSHDSKKLASRANGIDRRKEAEAIFQSRGPENKSKDALKTDLKYKTDIKSTENIKKPHPKIESSNNSQKLPIKNERSEFKKPSSVIDKERPSTGMSGMNRPVQQSGKPNLLKAAQAAAREAALKKTALLKEREVINMKKPQSDIRAKEFPPKDLKPKQFPPKDLKQKEFPPRDLKPKEFPPRDLKPKQFPPPDMKRRPKPPVKRRIEDDDEEYDSEMDDFIDDGPVEDEDYSKHIAEIFGYDKNKYRYMEDEEDECMESSFGQLEKEEKFSLIQGVMEDLEDIRKEKREKERVKLKKLQKMQATRR